MPDKSFKAPARGETLVWFTSLGLAIGLLMVAAVLLLIIVQGVHAFWPRQVTVITLKQGSGERAGIMGAESFAGELLKVQPKILRQVTGDDQAAQTESQFFVGNKDVYGFAFKYLDDVEVARLEQPATVIRLERVEYGPLLGEPVSLDLKDQAPLPATEPGFAKALALQVAQSNRLRRELHNIEKEEIGAINSAMERYRLKIKALRDKLPVGVTQDPRITDWDKRTTALDAEYQELATKARELRDRLNQHTLQVRLHSGQLVPVALGKVIDYYYPNQLGSLGRLSRWGYNVSMFLKEEPREANTEGGIFPAIFGTFVMTLLMSLAVTPFGVLAAIYLHEYAKQGPMVRATRIAVNNLAGVPSIVFGVFGLGFFVYFVGGSIDRLFFADALPTPTFGTGGVLWASLTLALLTVPVVVVAAEEALSSVPRGVREGSLAMGASKWQTIQRVVLPAAAPGILTGLILAMARGSGEVAPLMLVGVVKLAPTLPINGAFPFVHLDQKFMHLGFHIYDLGFQSPDSEAAKPMVFATTLFLIALVVLLNLTGILVREHLRRKYKASVF